MAYTETRSKRALAIDRALQARQVYGGFNSAYANSPNRSDVQDHDTKGKYRLPPPTARPKPKIQLKKATTEYLPTPSERLKLVPHFHKLNIIDQHKDLLNTKRVIKNKANISRWKKNPKSFDIRGIDTRPPELVPARIDVLKKHSGVDRIQIKKFNWRGKSGDYGKIADISLFKGGRTMPTVRHGRTIIKDFPIGGLIRVDTSHGKVGSKPFNRVLSHELGHGYDRNVIGKMLSPQKYERHRGTGNLNFGNIKPLKGMNTKFGIMDKAKAKNLKQVESITRLKISPYKKGTNPTFERYRNSSQELFANWFSGYITDKRVVKKGSKGFYNIFKKSNKPLVKALRMSDKNITKKFMGGIKLPTVKLRI